jgi:serine/threonine protein kinase
MTWTLQNKYYMLFPWARCDLDGYWKYEPRPEFINTETKPVNGDTIRWIPKQILGLAGALERIHDPRHLGDDKGGRVYGRHGDLKPKNILFFEGPPGSRGTLVISDLGLGQLNSENSRSNIPAAQTGVTPAYRPPEFDIQGGKASRSSDIWQLGCVLLEFVCWILGGDALRGEFWEERMSPYITGTVSDIFFDAKLEADGNTVFMVKEVISKVR